MCSFDDGLSSVQIARQLGNIASERIARTKDSTQKVKRHFSSKNRQRAGRLAESLDVYKETMRRLIHDALDLRAYHITTQLQLTKNHTKRRVSFAYRVRKELRKRDHGQIMCTDENFCSLEGVFNRQNERVDAVSREDADRGAGINQRSNYPRRTMIWLGVSKNGFASLIIYQQDNSTLQVHRKSLAFCAENF